MLKTGSLILSAILLVNAAAIAGDDASAYRKDVEAWRTARLERLKSPYGWPSLVGLEWLKEGANTIGSAKDNAIVIAKAPPRL